jgi:hypothetical protein
MYRLNVRRCRISGRECSRSPSGNRCAAAETWRRRAIGSAQLTRLAHKTGWHWQRVLSGDAHQAEASSIGASLPERAWTTQILAPQRMRAHDNAHPHFPQPHIRPSHCIHWQLHALRYFSYSFFQRSPLRCICTHPHTTTHFISQPVPWLRTSRSGRPRPRPPGEVPTRQRQQAHKRSRARRYRAATWPPKTASRPRHRPMSPPCTRSCATPLQSLATQRPSARAASSTRSPRRRRSRRWSTARSRRSIRTGTTLSLARTLTRASSSSRRWLLQSARPSRSWA